MTIRDALQRAAKSRHRIATQLYAGIGAAVTVTLIASLVAWLAFNRVGAAQNRVNERSVPQMSAAFAIAQRAGDLVNAAPRLAAATSRDLLRETTANINERRSAFETELDKLQGDDTRHQRIRDQGQILTANIDAIGKSVARGFDLADLRRRMADEVTTLQEQLSRDILLPAIDDQFFFALTGFQSPDRPAVARHDHLSEEQVVRYRHLADLHNDATQGAQLLLNAFNLTDALLLEPLLDRFNATMGRIDRNLSSITDLALREAVSGPFARLRQLGLGKPDRSSELARPSAEIGGFALRQQELALVRDQQELLAKNSNLIKQLVDDMESLVANAGASAIEATHTAEQTINTGRALLLGLNVVSVIGAGLIAWLFVGRVLLRRIGRLSDRMQAMADGDLEAEVNISGHDEVADMAAALEVFRRHALEVQRLNLVEQLAEELRGKNEQLEKAFSDLEQAQDQMVAREKLAALGELTAGVAHEIKNPLNFVKNFSEASEELLAELKEALAELPSDGDEDKAKDGDNPREAIEEIYQDLVENLSRIRSHGERADRIVRDMLSMGRHTGARQATDINLLLDEHARLAFHAVRSRDSDFQLDIQKELDPTVGEVEVMPQDLGRVILNMVTNACYAVDQRRRAEAEKDAEYWPKLTLTTHRLEDGVRIGIRDNGTGMPKDVVDKIFNPFFTTKPTDQGTGLGLSLSNDIVRQHGGTISVESEPGQFTQMFVEIPLTPPPTPEDSPADDNAGEPADSA